MYSIDLHAHTTASDGSLTPAQLVSHAAEVGLTALAITDHDTVDGLAEAIDASKMHDLELVPGIELAVDYRPGRFHMLGYLIDPDSRILADRLVQLKQNRARRNALMVEKLQSLGLPITLEEVLAESGGGVVGRPHMAAVLTKKGIVTDTREAFQRYVGEGKPGHVPKDKIGVEEGIGLIHAAGGLAVMAHPSSLHLEDDKLALDLIRLRELGLDGVECYYNRYTPERTESLLHMAKDAGLLVTGGSDFHGAAKPDVHLGHVVGDEAAPGWILDALKQAQPKGMK